MPEPLGEGGYGAAQHRLFASGALVELIQQAQAQLLKFDVEFEFAVAARGVVFGAACAAYPMLVHPVHFAILTDQTA